MDRLRSCYQTRMRFWREDPTEVEVVWYFTRPGVQRYSGYTRFSSGNYADPKEGWLGVGEVSEAPRPWSNGQPPAHFPARQVCGTAEQFAEGAVGPPDAGPPRTRDGVLFCCQPLGLFGAEAGGSFLVPRPERIPGLVEWWRADALYQLADGAPVTAWPGLSKYHRVLTCPAGPGAPTLQRVLWPNGVTVQFSTLGSGLQLAGRLPVGTQFTTYIVGQYSGFAFFATGVQLGSPATPPTRVPALQRTVQTVAVPGQSITAAVFPPFFGNVWSVRCSAATLEFRRNGVAVASSPAALTRNPRIEALGAIASAPGPTPSFPLVAEVLVYGRALSDAEDAAVNAYFRARYFNP